MQSKVISLVLGTLLLQGGLSAQTLRCEEFGSAEEFLLLKRLGLPSCLVLAVRLRGMSGLDLQSQLVEADDHIPVIFITAYGDVSMSVQAMKAGAVDFVTKPLRDQDVLDAIHLGLERDRDRRDREIHRAPLQERLNTLTPREREVVAYQNLTRGSGHKSDDYAKSAHGNPKIPC